MEAKKELDQTQTTADGTAPEELDQVLVKFRVSESTRHSLTVEDICLEDLQVMTEDQMKEMSIPIGDRLKIKRAASSGAPKPAVTIAEERVGDVQAPEAPPQQQSMDDPPRDAEIGEARKETTEPPEEEVEAARAVLATFYAKEQCCCLAFNKGYLEHIGEKVSWDLHAKGITILRDHSLSGQTAQEIDFHDVSDVSITPPSFCTFMGEVRVTHNQFGLLTLGVEDVEGTFSVIHAQWQKARQ